MCGIYSAAYFPACIIINHEFAFKFLKREKNEGNEKKSFNVKLTLLTQIRN